MCHFRFVVLALSRLVGGLPLVLLRDLLVGVVGALGAEAYWAFIQEYQSEGFCTTRGFDKKQKTQTNNGEDAVLCAYCFDLRDDALEFNEGDWRDTPSEKFAARAAEGFAAEAGGGRGAAVLENFEDIRTASPGNLLSFRESFCHSQLIPS